MIELTRMNRDPLVVNAEVIVTIEATPDTLVTLTTGERLHVLEPVAEVVSRVVAYKRQILGSPAAKE